MKITKTKILFAFAILFLNFMPAAAQENGIIVKPAIIERGGEARAIFEEKISLQNNNKYKTKVYVIIKNLDQSQGEQPEKDPSLYNKTSSLASWMEIKRGAIELGQGQTIEIPLKIEINLRAKPEKYYANIYFSQGATREEAEKQINEKNKTLVSIAVTEHIVKKAQLKSFAAKNNLYIKSPVQFLFKLENIGNRAVPAEGQIIIYNKKGEEVEALKTETADIAAGETKNFEIFWKNWRNFGHYKAVARINFGENETTQDTIFFWAIPLKIFLLVNLLLFAFLILLAGLVLHSHRIIKEQYKAMPFKAKETNEVIDL